MEIPAHYDDWKNCITVKCQIALTPHYIEERIKILSNLGHVETRKFRELYGESHHQAVLNWFRKAAREN
jgi:hypothetical protein